MPSGELGVEPYAWHRYSDRPAVRRLLRDRTPLGSRRIIPPDLSDVRAARMRPWILVLWEPLTDRVPGPHLSQPWCCYLDTVIFYCRPYQELPPSRYLSWSEWSDERYANGNPKLRWLDRPVIKRESSGSFAEYERLEYRLRFDDHILFDGVVWHMGGGSVVWRRPWWYMRHEARRSRDDSRCGGCVTAAQAGLGVRTAEAVWGI